MKSKLKLTMAALAAVAATGSFAQSIGASCGCPPVSSRTTVTLDNASSPLIMDAQGNQIPASVTFTCNNLYVLNDKYYVPAGKDLFIEPGTVIKANNIGGGNAAAMVVSRDGQIWANGSESCPIIFTAFADPLDGTYNVTNRGKWGGLIVLGKAYNNIRQSDVGSVALTGTNGVGLIEGLTNEARNYYGATVGNEVNNDNSGVLRYVSCRYGGEILGTNNEINGMTFGSVGSGTTLDHLEVVSNQDDAFEFFGGTVNAKYLVAMHCDDDYVDTDQGFSGRIQFVYGLQGPDNRGGALNQGDNGLELDADDHPTNATNGGIPSTAQIWNATFLSRADGSATIAEVVTPAQTNPNPTTSGYTDEGIEAKERTQGSVNNSIFVNFRSGLNLIGAVGGANTTDIWLANNFNVKNCSFQNCASPLRINGSNVSSGADFTKFTVTDGNVIVASGLIPDATSDFSPVNPNSSLVVVDRVNPVPAAGSATTTLKPAASETFLTAVQYRGAFEPGSTPWTQGWTLTADIGSDVSAVAGCVGDLNKDGLVNSTDYGLFVNAFNSTCY
jgi:hypothetical protein